MGKVVEYTVKREYEIVRNVLRELFSTRLSKLLKTQGSMVLNGNEQIRADRKVFSGDVLTFTFPDESSDYEAEEMDILPVYEDEDYLIIDKGQGITCIPTGGRTLFSGLKKLYPAENFHVITRLDKDTAGLVLLAKSSLAAGKMHRYPIEKIYTVLCEGEIAKPVTINAPIVRAGDIRRVVSKDGKPSVTIVTPIKFDGENTLAECKLLTGRTHQIRVHLSHIGHAVVGDTLYGNGTGEYNSGQKLLCSKLRFVQPLTGKEVAVSSQRSLYKTISGGKI